MRSCKSFVFSNNAIYGTHQKIERNISQRRYVLNDVRQGYNTPFSTEWHFMEYRCKKEILSEFARDLGAINLNPHPNQISLYMVFKRFDNISTEASVGILFRLIQWVMKWVNRKKTTSIILGIISILTLQLWLWLFIILILVNPVKPVEIAKGESNTLSNGDWAYTYIFGYLSDPTEVMHDKRTKETYTQEDVL